MQDFIQISGLGSTAITATDNARAQRDTLLQASTTVTTVNSADSATIAANTLKDIKALTRMIEDGRTSAKAPVLELGKKIDALAKELTTNLEAEATRISRILGTWQAEQNRIAEEARRKAFEEERRIREEAARNERAAAEAARAQQEELERKASVARTEEKAAEYRQQAEAAQLRAHQEQERRDLAAEQAIVSTRVSAAAVAAPRPAGVAVRKEIKFEVTDATALYEAAPYLLTLTPNTAAIKAALKALSPGQHLPGVRHWEEALTVVR